MVVFLAISNCDIKRILVDNKSSVDIFFYDAFFKMGLSRDHLQRANTPLISLSRDDILVEGIVTLLIIAGRVLK